MSLSDYVTRADTITRIAFRQAERARNSWICGACSRVWSDRVPRCRHCEDGGVIVPVP